jgi:hypothetical protein
MKSLKLSVTISLIIGFFSLPALIFLFLSLADIAHQESDLALEWRIAGISMIIISVFLLSAAATFGFLLKNWNQLFKE